MNLQQVREYSTQIHAIARKHGIYAVYVFGSVARADEKSSSDVDFLVEMLPDASLFGMAGFMYEVEKLLGVQVDVVPLSVLSQVKDRTFVSNIQKEAVAL